MPLIMLCGIPCSGKSQLAVKISEHFQQLNKKVVIVDDSQSSIPKSEIYCDSKTEKIVRGELKSLVEHSLNQETIVIADSCNYIKGFRYELFCIAKTHSTTSCVVYPDLSLQKALDWNAQLNEEIQYPALTLEQVAKRVEKPNGRNRWDKPLFTVSEQDMVQRNFPLEDIQNAILHGKAPKAGLATQSVKTGEANFVHELDHITQQILDAWTHAQQLDSGVVSFRVPSSDRDITSHDKVSVPQMRRLRRQFIKIAQLNPMAIPSIGTMFVDFINTELNKK